MYVFLNNIFYFPFWDIIEKKLYCICSLWLFFFSALHFWESSMLIYSYNSFVFDYCIKFWSSIWIHDNVSILLRYLGCFPLFCYNKWCCSEEFEMWILCIYIRVSLNCIPKGEWHAQLQMPRFSSLTLDSVFRHSS